MTEAVLCISVLSLCQNTLALPNYDNEMSPDTGKLITSLNMLLTAKATEILGHRHGEGKTDCYPIPSHFLHQLTTSHQKWVPSSSNLQHGSSIGSLMPGTEQVSP